MELAARLLTFEHAASAAGKKLRFTVGDFDAEATTNAKGAATVEMPVEQSYGTHELKVSFAGDQGQGLRAAEARWMFEVLWEHTFADDDAPDQAVRINTITKGLQHAPLPGM